MSCEHYKQGLIEAAAACVSQPLPLDLRAHLDSCAICRAKFEDERHLFATIDSSLRAAANAPVPPSLLPAVHLRLAQEDATNAKSKRSPSVSWMYLAAAAALVLALIPLLRPHRANPLATQNQDETATASALAPPAHSGLQSIEPVAARPHIANPQHHPSPLDRQAKAKPTPQSRFVRARAGQPPPPEVLVPFKERLAFAKYIASASGQKSLIVIRTIPAAETENKSLTIEPLKIAALNVKSLEEQQRQMDDERQTR